MNLLTLLIYILILGTIFYVLWWAIAKINPPEPFKKIAQVLVVLVVVVVLIKILLSLTGGDLFDLRLRGAVDQREGALLARTISHVTVTAPAITATDGQNTALRAVCPNSLPAPAATRSIAA